jgi:uncharacterized protein (TIGR02145 family)
MNIKYFITTLLIATTLVACSDIDEVDNSNLRNEVKIFASVTERDADDSQSRANLDGTGAGTIGNGKAIRLNYTNGTSSGSMVYTFGETPLYWDDLIAEIGNPPFSFTAYYPVVPADISTTGFNVVTTLDPDLLAAHISGVNDGQGVNLVFNHIMHKLEVNLTSSQGTFDATQLANATVTLQNLRSIAAINANGTVNLNSASGNDTYPSKRGANNFFIVASQIFWTGLNLLEIEVAGKTFTYVPTNVSFLESGKILTLDLNLNNKIEEELEQEKGVEINGVVWAPRNVGAPGTFIDKPEDAGMFYQWNRRTGWSSTNPMVNSSSGVAWDTSISTATTWERMNDPCPNGWRIPTRAELNSLMGSENKWTDRNNVNGRLFGTAPNRIFLPAAGARSSLDGRLGSVNAWGFYWSRDGFFPADAAWCLTSSLGSIAFGHWRKAEGISIRCVAE